METQVAVMRFIVENRDAVERLHAILHEHGEFIIGRMETPYRKRGISIISIALDAPQNTISSLAGKTSTLMEPMIAALTAKFSWPQLITALTCGALALVIAPIVRKALKK